MNHNDDILTTYALSIGNSKYQNFPQLPNDKQDAERMSHILEDLGYKTTVLLDVCKSEIEKEIHRIAGEANVGSIIVVYFSGHGVEIDGENFLIGIDLPQITKANYKDIIKEYSISLNNIVNILDKANFSIKVIIVDACRSNPVKSIIFADDQQIELLGFAPISKTSIGTFFAFSTTSGLSALPNGVFNNNSLYTESLLKYIPEKIPIEECFKKVRNEVYLNSGKRQLPWEHSALTTYFSLNYKGYTIDQESEEDLLPNPYIKLNNQVNELIYRYENDAIYEPTDNIDINTIIEGMRSHNWYTQHTAVNTMLNIRPSDVDKEYQFLMGRNILQTAIGGEYTAESIFNRLLQWLLKWNDKEGNNHILNGILYEMYFNSHAEFRGTSSLKSRYVDSIFSLSNQFEPSFKYINRKLLNYVDYLYYVPSIRMQSLKVAIDAEEVEDTDFLGEKMQFYNIKGIMINNMNVLAKHNKTHLIGYEELIKIIKYKICIDDAHLSIVWLGAKRKEDYNCMVPWNNILIDKLSN